MPVFALRDFRLRPLGYAVTRRRGLRGASKSGTSSPLWREHQAALLMGKNMMFLECAGLTALLRAGLTAQLKTANQASPKEGGVPAVAPAELWRARKRAALQIMPATVSMVELSTLW